MQQREAASPFLVHGIQVAAALAFFTFWELTSRAHPHSQFLFSRPLLIAARAIEWVIHGKLWANAWITFEEALYGFALGAVAGLCLALLAYGSELIGKILMPLLEIGNAVPRFVFGPLCMLWFGFGVLSKAVLSASLVLFIVFFATYTALLEVDQNLLLKVRLLGGTRRHLLTHVLLPSALTWVFSSLRTGLGFALAGAVVGEYMGSSKGLGYHIALSEALLDSTGVFTGLMWLTLLAILMNVVLGRIESWISRWRVT